MGAAEEPKQIQFRKWKQPQNFQDKRLQELRTFALEYVKQIVAKASELSQQQQQQQAGQPNGCGQIAAGVGGSIALAAKQINENFRVALKETPRKQANNCTKSSCQPEASLKMGPEAEPEESRVPSGREELLRRIQTDSDNEQDRGMFDSSSKQARVQESAGKANKSQQRRRLSERLNWHLFVSCLGNCLPHTLVESTTGSGTGGPTGGARGNAGRAV